MTSNKNFAKFININGKYRFYNDESDLIKIYQEELDQLINSWNKLEKHIVNYFEEWQNDEDEWIKGKCDMARDILYDMEEIKEGNNER